MYKNKSIGVVIPAFNEGSQISSVIHSMPEFVDKIIVVDDCSTDNTTTVVEACMKKTDKLILLKHENNQGCGGALITGYKWVRDQKMDVSVRMDGDGQMDPDELSKLLDPIIEGRADYSKGNRLFTGQAYNQIPKIRYFGNAILSLLTKIVSGYWHIADSQSGYSAINKKVLDTIEWNKMYKRYGQPNDLLILLNVENFRVVDVPITPIYNIGETSGIKIRKVMFTISWLLIRRFFWRLKEKYIIRDFHPLIFFYFFGLLFMVMSILLFFRLCFVWSLTGHIPSINALAMMFSFMSSSLFTLFAMWFDMETNKHLK